jgi:hypothetical protein
MMKQMKTVFFLTTILFTLPNTDLWAQETPATTDERATYQLPLTTIAFAATTYDFGNITEGEIATHVFTFTNTGDEPLILTNARGSCGCTVPNWPKDPILPGETASITVSFNSKMKRGKRNQKVTLTANTNPPQTFIYMTGQVTPKTTNESDLTVEDKAVESQPALSPDCFTIFPNPTAEVFSVKIEETYYGKPASVSILSEAGQLMARRNIDSVIETVRFDVSHYPPGIYTAVVKIGENTNQSQCFVVVE